MKLFVQCLSMIRLPGLALVLALSQAAFAQQDFSQVEVVPRQLTDSLYYLEGQGGNIGVSIGEDGVFLIDDQFAPLTEKIIAAVGTLTDQKIRFLMNTHYHGDHTGGNQNLGREGVVIIAHENVRTTLAAGFTNGDLTQALTAEQKLGLPVITFTETVDLHLNGEDIHVFYVGPAHTDGDSFVMFKNANIIHTGDVFRTTGFPRVDGNANGSFHGIVAAYELLLEMSDADTVFLPGHGVLSSQSDVRSQLEMFLTIRDRIQSGIDAGNSLEQVQASAPTAEYDARWGNGGTTGEDLVAVVYAELIAMQ